MAKCCFVQTVLVLCAFIEFSQSFYHIVHPHHRHHHQSHDRNQTSNLGFVVPEYGYASPFGMPVYGSVFDPMSISGSAPYTVVHTTKRHHHARKSHIHHGNMKPQATTVHVPKHFYVPTSPALRTIDDFAKTVHDLAKMVHDMHPEKANAAQEKALEGKGMHLRKDTGTPAKDLKQITHDVAELIRHTEDQVDPTHHSKSPKPQSAVIDKLDKAVEDLDPLADPSKRVKDSKTVPVPNQKSLPIDSTQKKHHGGRVSPAVARSLEDFDKGIHSASELIMDLRPDIKEGQAIPRDVGKHILNFDPDHHRNPIVDVVNFIDDLKDTVLDIEQEMDPEGDHDFKSTKKASKGHHVHKDPVQDLNILAHQTTDIVKNIEEEIALAKSTGEENPRLTGLVELLDVADGMALSLHHSAVSDEMDKKYQDKRRNSIHDLARQPKNTEQIKNKQIEHTSHAVLSQEEITAQRALKCAQRSKNCQTCLIDNECFFCATDNTCLPTLNFTTSVLAGDKCPLKDVYFMHACKVKFVTTIIIWVFAALFSLLIFILLVVFALSYKRNKSKLYKRIQSKEREILDAPEFANADLDVHDFDE